VAGVDRVAGGVVGDQRFAFFFRGSVLIFLAVLVAQLLNLSWLESPGTGTASDGVLASLPCCVKV
jgi:hypothetical protein